MAQGAEGGNGGELVFMDEGRIVEVGPPEHFFESPEDERTKRFLVQIL